MPLASPSKMKIWSNTFCYGAILLYYFEYVYILGHTPKKVYHIVYTHV